MIPLPPEGGSPLTQNLVETLSAKRKGHVVELTIEGRYEEGK